MPPSPRSPILDFRMAVSRTGQRDGLRKEEANGAATVVALRRAMHPSVWTVWCSPVQPSAAKDDAGYDSWLARVLPAVRPGRPLDVGELILETCSAEPTQRRSAWLPASDIRGVVPDRQSAASRDVAVLLFQLINARHEHASTVLTSNKGFEEWGADLGDEVMAATLIDRLLYHCHIVNIRGNGYRMRKHQEMRRSLQAPEA